MVQPHRARSWWALALACILLVVACAAGGCLAAATPHTPAGSSGSLFEHTLLLAAPQLRPGSRQLAAAVNGSQSVVSAAATSAEQQQLVAAGFDAVPAIPLDQLGWLRDPATWEVWEPPAEQRTSRGDGSSTGGGDGVGRIAGESDASNRDAAARAAVVQQVMAQVDAASLLAARKLVAADDVAAAAAATGKAAASAAAVAVAAATVPAEGRRLLESASAAAYLRRLLAEGNTSAGTAPRGLVAAAAARKPAPRPGKRPVVKPAVVRLLPNIPRDGRFLSKLFQPNQPIQPPSNRAFPPFGLAPAPRARPSGCLFAGNVKQRGVWARGDGVTNDAPALAKTNKMPGLRYLYFPVGVYRLKTSLTLTKPVIMGANTKFLLDRGVRLTLLAQPKRAPLWFDPMFHGPGTVVMGRAVLEVYPAWWSDPKLLDGQILQLASRACTNACTVVLTRPMSIRGATMLAPGAGLFATAEAIFFGWNSKSGDGLVLPAGNYLRPLVFAGIHSFSKWGLKILPGVVNANIQAGQVSTNGDGIVFEGSPRYKTSRVTVSHISVMQKNQHSIVFNSPKPKCQFEAVTVRLNFLVSGGMQDGMENKPSSGVIFRGVPPILLNTQVIIQAIDPAQFVKRTRFVAATTATSGPVDRFVLRSDCWNGGYELPSGAQVDGSWTRSAFIINFSDQVGGRVFEFRKWSSKNTLLNGDVGHVAAAGRFWNLAAAPGTLDMFKKANPLQNGDPPLPVRHQGFYVGIRIPGKWPPGQQRTYYLHSIFANAAVLPRPDCVPFRDDNPGLHCVKIAVQPARGSPNRVAVSIMNLSRKVIPPGFYFRFGIQL